LENKTIVYKTLRDVKEGEELCISYGANLTFKDVEMDEDEEHIGSGLEGFEALSGLDS
jgi:uncharacterized protein